MAMEDSLNTWMQNQVKGDILAAVGHRQTASLVAVERVRDGQSSEVRLDLHIYQWYKSLIGTDSDKSHYVQQKTCFIKAFDDQLEFDANQELNVEIALSKNGDLLSCVVNGDVYGRHILTCSHTV
jgi:hypothetical protein